MHDNTRASFIPVRNKHATYDMHNDYNSVAMLLPCDILLCGHNPGLIHADTVWSETILYPPNSVLLETELQKLKAFYRLYQNYSKFL